MKNSFLPFVLFLVSVFAEAHNFELFPPNQETYFHFTGENMDAISPFYVDAVEIVNDIEYQYILRNYINGLSEGCYEALLISNNFLYETEELENHVRFPNEVIIQQNGWYGETIFEANPNTLPTLVFNTQANVGDKWAIESEAYQDFDQIEVECVNIEVEVFLGGSDNVKTFHLQALLDGTPVSSHFNSIAFKISEKYGLISGIPLKELLQNQPTTQMQLVGFENENGEFQGRGAYTIMDFIPQFQVGDILKWYDVHQAAFHRFETYHRDSIIAVEATENSITYHYDRVSYESLINPISNLSDENNFYTTLNQKQSYSIHSHETSLELMYYGLTISDEFLGNDIWAIQNRVQNPYDTGLQLAENSYFNMWYIGANLEPNCSHSLFVGHSTHNYYYHPTVGLVIRANWFDDKEILIGYRIGNEQGGDIDPIITNIQEESYFASQITLHPNPTQNRFLLQLKNPKQTLQSQNLLLKITDIHGRTLQQSPLLQSSIEVDLSNYSNGIYLVQISDGVNWWTEKVVKY